MVTKVFYQNLTSDSDVFPVTCNTEHNETNIPLKIVGLKNSFLYMWGSEDEKDENQVESRIVKGPISTSECESSYLVAENIIFNSFDAVKLKANDSFVSVWEAVKDNESNVYVALEMPEEPKPTPPPLPPKPDNKNHTTPSNHTSNNNETYYDYFLDYVAYPVLIVGGSLAATWCMYRVCKMIVPLFGSESVSSFSRSAGEQAKYDSVPLGMTINEEVKPLHAYECTSDNVIQNYS